MIHKLKNTENGFYIGQGSTKEIERLFLERVCKHIICNQVTYDYLISSGLINGRNITWSKRNVLDYEIYINRFL